MPRRSRENLGIYAPRTSRRPTDIPNRGPGTPSAGGGDKFESWTELPLDPSSGWSITSGDNATAIGATIAKVGNELHFKAPSAIGMRIQGSQMRGMFMARSIHLKPWIQSGVTMPDGQAINQFQPEAFHLKIQVEFATSNGGPISGGTVSGADGHYLTCMVGLAGYGADQSGSPNATGYLWSAAQVLKAAGGDPASSTNVNMYQSGYKSYFTNSGIQAGQKWANMQSGGGAAAHDALVYATSPLKKGDSTLPGNIQAGSYSTTVPFSTMATLHHQLHDNSTKLSNQSIQKFWHIALWFGTHTNTGGRGEIRIRSIKYVLQPIQGRVDLS